MVQGTASHVGKSIITAALCRIFHDMGLSTAPFKAQNMSLNAFVTRDGGEIGVAQALQARAAGLEPTVDMNPVLLKPTEDGACQVIVHGRVYGAMTASSYQGFKEEALGPVLESFERLAAAHDAVVLEGAGSPAEINLRENDLANMGIALATESPVLLVGDIDRGGVFASLVGTMELLGREERSLVRGFIINKFRGDASLLGPGLDFLVAKTGVPVMGVVPYMGQLVLPDEDGVVLEDEGSTGGGRDGGQRGGRKGSGPGAELRIVVIRLPRISNFTDFDPLRHEEGVELVFIENPGEIKGAAMVIIPGTKNTRADLLWLSERGFREALREYRSGGGLIMGICGGFQMLGRAVEDPLGVESLPGRSQGLGLLDISTRLGPEKATFTVEAEVLRGFSASCGKIKGYEIHAGWSTPSERAMFRILRRGSAGVEIEEGAVSRDRLVMGTYIHGLFHNDGLRRALVQELFRRAGLEPIARDGRGYEAALDTAIDEMAALVRASLDMEALLRIVGLGGPGPLDSAGPRARETGNCPGTQVP